MNALRRSFATMAALPCDMLFTAHPDQSGGDAAYRRLLAGAQPDPFVDPAACRAYAARFRAKLDATIARELSARRSPPPPPPG